MKSLLNDVRHTLRLLRKNPGFTTIAVGSLALGLGANTAIFSLLDQVLLRPLPVTKPSELVLLESPGANRGMFNGDNSDRLFSYPMYRQLRDGTTIFSNLAAQFPTTVSVSYRGQSQAAPVEVVSGNMFDMLGLQAAAGRLLRPEDDTLKGANPVVVLGHGFWTRRFARDPNIVNQVVRINNTPMTVIGVAPKGYFGLDVGRTADLYIPLSMKAQVTPTWDRLEDPTAHFLHILGRTKPGLESTQAEGQIQPLWASLLRTDLMTMTGTVSEKFKQRYLQKHLILRSGHNGIPVMQEQSGTPLKVLMGMVGLVLLIACANVANLLLARALGRQRELAIRSALGANRSDLIRRLLVESVTLALLGGIAGFIVAAWTGDLLLRSLPGEMATRGLTAALESRTILFGFVLSVLTGLIFGVLPALPVTRPDVHGLLKNQAGSVIGAFGQLRSRQALVAMQMSLSLLLLFGAGLFTRSLLNLQHLDPGFQTSNMMLFTIDASRNGYQPARITQFYDTLQSRIAALPGVRSVGAAEIVMLSGDTSSSSIRVAGYQPKPDENMNVVFDRVTPGYLGTLGIDLRQGRDFGPQDKLGAPRTAIVNEAFVRRYLEGRSALGNLIGVGGDKTPQTEIVGVVRDGKYSSLRNEISPIIYLPFAQSTEPGTITFHVRTVTAPEPLMNPVRKLIAQEEPNLAIADVKTMQAQLEESLFTERLIAVLCMCFGVLATLLAAIGLYGVTSFAVARRTREIGIRMALGAARESVLSLILREVVLVCLSGIIVGIPVALALSRLVQSQLYGIAPYDATTLLSAIGLLLGVSLAAGFTPARRAASVDPLVALRYE